ncbi:hypothetical protein [Halalkalibacter oceani]|uniref:hypothetical protein n=1 Tax=Halalkalibacter oceani TaxID=1653776 RepID=UPI00339B10CC
MAIVAAFGYLDKGLELSYAGLSIALISMSFSVVLNLFNSKDTEDNKKSLNAISEQLKVIESKIQSQTTDKDIEEQIELLRQEIANQRTPKFSLITNNFIKKEDQ